MKHIEMKHIEPTGVVFTAVCDIQTDKCVARQAAPITAVWANPGHLQINVCRACLEEMIRQGEWHIEGARIRQRADVVVYDNEGKPALVVEAKLAKSKENTETQAVKIRRNLAAHFALPNTEYFMVAFPDYFYVWNKASIDPIDRPADFKIDGKTIIKKYSAKLGLQPNKLSPMDFERLVSEWLKDLTSPNEKVEIPKSIIESGLFKAIQKGTITVESSI